MADLIQRGMLPEERRDLRQAIREAERTDRTPEYAKAKHRVASFDCLMVEEQIVVDWGFIYHVEDLIPMLTSLLSEFAEPFHKYIWIRFGIDEVEVGWLRPDAGSALMIDGDTNG